VTGTEKKMEDPGRDANSIQQGKGQGKSR
jgi:hypothetical protein